MFAFVAIHRIFLVLFPQPPILPGDASLNGLIYPKGRIWPRQELMFIMPKQTGQIIYILALW